VIFSSEAGSQHQRIVGFHGGVPLKYRISREHIADFKCPRSRADSFHTDVDAEIVVVDDVVGPLLWQSTLAAAVFAAM